MSPILKLTHITKTFLFGSGDRRAILKDIDLEIFPREFFVILGPSGSGKSTILRIMSGLETEYGGEMALGEGITTKDISFVFQQFALLPWLTVFQNVELGLIARRVEPQKRRMLVERELKKIGLGAFANAYPKELSGGMRQRTGIARALVTNPKIIFMDEPFSELDSFIAEELRKEILAICETMKPTVVMVTHNIDEALELGDRIAVLTSQPAKIEKILTNTLPRPRNMRSAEFYGLRDELYRLVKS